MVTSADRVISALVKAEAPTIDAESISAAANAANLSVRANLNSLRQSQRSMTYKASY
jgi:hypothetical protein